MKARFSPRWRRLLVSSGTLLALSGCPLTDQQITSIMQSAISTGLNALVSNILQSLFTVGADTATTG
jgi:hypothetical protein